MVNILPSSYLFKELANRLISLLLLLFLLIKIVIGIPALADSPMHTNAQCAISPSVAYQQVVANYGQPNYNTSKNNNNQRNKKTDRLVKNTMADSNNVISLGIININTATAGELTQLPRIGTKTAQAIIRYRQQHGNFQRIEDLTLVKGIGKKTLAKIADNISVK